jgi:hypothetical protein
MLVTCTATIHPTPGGRLGASICVIAPRDADEGWTGLHEGDVVSAHALDWETWAPLREAAIERLMAGPAFLVDRARPCSGVDATVSDVDVDGRRSDRASQSR